VIYSGRVIVEIFRRSFGNIEPSEALRTLYLI
jgi:hypothetical protein